MAEVLSSLADLGAKARTEAWKARVTATLPGAADPTSTLDAATGRLKLGERTPAGAGWGARELAEHLVEAARSVAIDAESHARARQFWSGSVTRATFSFNLLM